MSNKLSAFEYWYARDALVFDKDIAWLSWSAAWDAAIASVRQIEPASAMQDDSPRMMAIGQNGNNGEHYE